jgi:N-acetylneuraminate synthase
MGRDFSFILEAGVNHDGSLDRAHELIESAARTKADYIKFQTYTSRKLAASHSPSYWDLSEEPTTSQRDLFSKYDRFTQKNYFDLATTAKKLGIGFMTTCFDSEWVDLLDPILTQYKIASADITNFQLLKHTALKGKPLLLSTGAATFSEIHAAVELISSVSNQKITLLHCVLNYPTATANASLDRILKLREEFPELTIGYSDHTKPADSFQAIEIAHALGATVFEKHFTWNESGQGNDHYHSFDEKGAREVILNLEKSLVLRNFSEESYIRVQEPARSFARRGLYAARKIIAGTSLRDGDLLPLRPPIGPEGVSANQIEEVIGRIVIDDVLEGDPIRWSNLT